MDQEKRIAELEESLSRLNDLVMSQQALIHSQQKLIHTTVASVGKLALAVSGLQDMHESTQTILSMLLTRATYELKQNGMGRNTA